MHQTQKNALRGSVLVALSLLVFLSITAIYDCAEARQNRGENYITGFSLSDFTGVGHIDSMEEGKLVIDDCTRTLSSDIEYYKSGPIKIPSTAFKVGSRVGYVEDRNGKIVSLWLLPAAKKRK